MTYLSIFFSQTAPKDKLLVYSVKEGWETLCKFLDVPIPSTPFPHKNKRGDIVAEWLATKPLFIRMRRETYFSVAMLVAACGYTMYSVSTKPFKDSVLGLPLKALDYLIGKLAYQHHR